MGRRHKERPLTGYYHNLMDEVVVRIAADGKRYKKFSNIDGEFGPCKEEDKSAFGGESFGYFHQLEEIYQEDYDNFNKTWNFDSPNYHEVMKKYDSMKRRRIIY